MLVLKLIAFAAVAAAVGIGFASHSDRKRMQTEAEMDEVLEKAEELYDLAQMEKKTLANTVRELTEENAGLRERVEELNKLLLRR